MAAVRHFDAHSFSEGHRDLPVAPGDLPGTYERLEGSGLLESVWLVRLSGAVPPGQDDTACRAIEELCAEGPILFDFTQLDSGQADQPFGSWVNLLAAETEPGHPLHGRVALVCSRALVRRLLAQQVPTAAVFSSQGDALQAKVMAGDGLGVGWSAPAAATLIRPRPILPSGRARRAAVQPAPRPPTTLGLV